MKWIVLIVAVLALAGCGGGEERDSRTGISHDGEEQTYPGAVTGMECPEGQHRQEQRDYTFGGSSTPCVVDGTPPSRADRFYEQAVAWMEAFQAQTGAVDEDAVRLCIRLMEQDIQLHLGTAKAKGYPSNDEELNAHRAGCEEGA